MDRNKEDMPSVEAGQDVKEVIEEIKWEEPPVEAINQARDAVYRAHLENNPKVEVQQENPCRPPIYSEIPVIYPPGYPPVPESPIPFGERCCLNCYHKFLHRCQREGKGRLLRVRPSNYCDLWEDKNAY